MTAKDLEERVELELSGYSDVIELKRIVRHIVAYLVRREEIEAEERTGDDQ